MRFTGTAKDASTDSRQQSHHVRYHCVRSMLVLLIYGLLSMAMTWPLAARLGTHIPAGKSFDVWTHQWTFWWIKKCIIEGQSPFYTDLIFHPHGVSLAYHNIAWLNIAFWLPLQAVFGSNAAYSLVYIGVFALNGFAMYLLARACMGSELAAFIGGLIYGFWPYTLSQSGHPNMTLVCWVPLALLYLKRVLEGGRKRDGVIAGLFLALTGIARWQLLIVGGVVVGLYVLYRCLTHRACRTWRALGLLALAGLVAVTLMAPLATPLVVAQITREYPEDAFVDQQTSKQTDLLALVLPNRSRGLWWWVAGWLGEDFQFTKDKVVFLGYSTMALALYGTVKRWGSARFWVVAGLVYVLLGLGPVLRVGDNFYPQVPMPYRLVGNLFLMRMLRELHRFNAFLGLPVGMLAALGADAVLAFRPHRRRSTALLGMAAVLILCEYCIAPYRTTRPVTPTWYGQLAQEPGRSAILDLPMGTRFFDKLYEFYQITHGRPLVEGHVSRLPREALDFLDSTPFLKRLHEENVMDPDLMNVTHQLQTLSEANVRHIVLHKELATTEQLAAWQDWLTFDPYHEDDELIVYRTSPRLGEDFVLTHGVADGIGLIRARRRPYDATRSDLIEIDARWAATAPPANDYNACLSLISAGGQAAQTECEPVCASWPTSRWDAGEVVRGHYALHVDHSLEPGVYTLTLALADRGSGAEVGHSVALGGLDVSTLPHVSAVPRPTHPLGTRWGEVILLRGYDLHTYPRSLELTLYWEARQKIDISYKVFVHLTDTATGAIASQDDAVPRRWTHPTTAWEPGALVEDTIPLSLEGVSTGQYRIALGLYEMNTGERLPAFAPDGERYADDVVPLTSLEW